MIIKVLASLVAVLLLIGTPHAAHAESGPPGPRGPALQEPEAKLRAALHCSEPRNPTSNTVLLVHGMTGDPDISWTWNYWKALQGKGRDVCTVALPDHGMADIQRSSEYVVHAVRTIHARTGRPVDTFGHSLGSITLRWAVKYWPDVQTRVGDLIMLGGASHGTLAMSAVCAPPVVGCAPGAWQLKPGSALLAALNHDDETPGPADVTSIFSLTDELLQPARASASVDGGSNVAVQDLCPVRAVAHNQLLADRVVYDLVLDALAHPGPADPARVGARCGDVFMPEAEHPVLNIDAYYALEVARMTAYIPHFVAREPPLRPYA